MNSGVKCRVLSVLSTLSFIEVLIMCLSDEVRLSCGVALSYNIFRGVSSK